MHEHHISRPHTTHHPVADYRSRRVCIVFGWHSSPASLRQTEGGSHATNLVVGAPVRRAKVGRPGNASFRDGFVDSAQSRAISAFVSWGKWGWVQKWFASYWPALYS